MNYTIESQRIRVKFRDGDIRWMMPLAYRVLRNKLKRIETGPRRKKGPVPKSHCKYGHPLSGDNVKLYRYGGRTNRICLACYWERSEKAKAAREAARQEVA